MRFPKTRRQNERPRRAPLLALLGSIAIAAVACAPNAPQDYLNFQKGPVAETADELWDITYWIAVAIFVIVEGLILFALWRFRERPGRKPATFHGNPKIEVVLTVVPALILAGLAVPTITTLVDLYREPEEAMEITVVAHQFWWEYQYDVDGDGETDFENANELHIPTNTPIRLRLLGDVDNADVIHSYWVPLLAGAQDVIPGRENFLTLSASEPGRYVGQCKEFCGLSHANMRLITFAEPPSEFEQWAEEQREAADATALRSQGARLFVAGEFAKGPPCATCHTINGLEVDGQQASGTLGPDLTHLASRETFASAIFELNEQNLRSWLADPPAMKPGVRMPDLGLTSEQIDALVSFLLSLE